MGRPYDIAVIPGDGIGPEVIAEGLRVLEAAFQAVGAGRRIDRAVEGVLAEGRVRTPDIGGTSKTDEVGRAVAEWIR